MRGVRRSSVMLPQLQRVGLGSSTEDRTVEDVVSKILNFNGFIMHGAYFDAVERVVDRIAATVEAGEDEGSEIGSPAGGKGW